MKPLIDPKSEPAVYSNDIGEQNQFSIKIDGHIFRTLMDGMYEHKVPSVVREILANAFDAHIEAGNTTDPVRVFLPSAFNHTFRIRDYGPGMTHDFVMKLYTQLGHSEKRTSDTQTGMFGLGSKSPFSITDQFTVMVFDGTSKRVYSAFINDDGIPVLSNPVSVPSAEPSGVEITIPVRQTDVSKFVLAVRSSAFAYFDKNIEFMTPDSESIDWGRDAFEKLYDGLYNGDDQHVYGKKMFIRQGFAVYPLNMEALSPPDEVRVFFDSLQRQHQYLYLDAPLGTFEVTASREGIQYSDISKKNILAIMWDIAEKATADIWEMVRDPKLISPRDIYWALGDGRGDSIMSIEFMYRLVRARVERRLGYAINFTTSFSPLDLKKHLPADMQLVTAHARAAGRLGANNAFQDSVISSQSSTISYHPTTLIVVCGVGTKNIEARIKAYVEEKDLWNKIQKYVFFRVPIDARDELIRAVQTMCSDYAYRTISDDDLPDVKVTDGSTRLSVSVPKWSAYTLNPTGEYWSTSRVSMKLTDAAYYVVRNGLSNNIKTSKQQRAMIEGDKRLTPYLIDPSSQMRLAQSVDYHSVRTIAREAAVLNLIDETIPVIRITPAQERDLLKKDTSEHNWVNLFDQIVPKLAELYEKHYLPGVIGRPSKMMTNIYSDVIEKLTELRDTPNHHSRWNLSTHECETIRRMHGALKHNMLAYGAVFASGMPTSYGGTNVDAKETAAVSVLVGALLSVPPSHAFKLDQSRDNVDNALRENLPLLASVNVGLSGAREDLFVNHLTKYLTSALREETMKQIEKEVAVPEWNKMCKDVFRLVHDVASKIKT